MLGVFSDGTEVIVCEIAADTQPMTKGYFTTGKKSDERILDDYDYALVDAPVRIDAVGWQWDGVDTSTQRGR